MVQTHLDCMRINKTSAMPYGLALMILRGATEDLECAISQKDFNRITICIERLSSAKTAFESSLSNYDNNSYVHRTYRRIEKESVNLSNIVLEQAIFYLRSSLKVVKL